MEWNKDWSCTDVICNDMKFPTMTPVQAAVIPLFIGNKDVCVQAQTGSGKTLAFLVPIIERIRRTKQKEDDNQVRSDKRIRALIVSPTRELASQIHQVAKQLLSEEESSLLLVGGASHSEDRVQLAESGGCELVIGTPGRISAVLRGQSSLLLDARYVEVLVLDEADRLLELGFQHTLQTILDRLPKQRRTGLFSATMPASVEELARAGLRNPARIEVQQHQSNVPSSLENEYVMVNPRHRLVILLDLLLSAEKSIVFVLTRAQVEYYTLILPKLVGREVLGIHGSMAQKRRDLTLNSFRERPQSILVCTDVAARGIDVPDTGLIVQFDAPQSPAFFVHRVGRTARMGREGRAVVMLNESEEEYVDLLKEKKVAIQQLLLEVDESRAEQIVQKTRKLALGDRNVMEKGAKAFVAYVRGYREHWCKYVLRWRKLNFGGVAHGMGLIFLPRMPDLKGFKIKFDTVQIDRDTITYKDKGREKQRQKNLPKILSKRKEERKMRRERYEKETQRKKEASRMRNKRRKHRNVDLQAEWDELANETRLLKKLKKGKISKKDFEIQVGERTVNE